MSTKYALLNINEDFLYDFMNEDEYSIFIDRIMTIFKDSNDNRDIDSFIKFFNKFYFISGNRRIQVTDNDYNYYYVTKPQDVSICEVIKHNHKDNSYTVRILPPEEIYINYKNLWGKKRPLPFNVNNYLYRKQHKFHYWTRTHTRSSNSFRDSSTKHSSFRQFTKISDKRYYRELDKVTPPRYRNQCPWDAFDDVYRSETGNWKQSTKDKHQWQHNLRDKSIYVDKVNSKQHRINEFYNDLEKYNY